MMSFVACEDCGCRVYGGICSNCQEELYILENQYEDMGPVSEEFMELAADQKEFLRRRNLDQIS